MDSESTNLILYRLDKQDDMLKEIRDHAKLTNGRVTTLEKWQARIDGARSALSWRVPLVIGVIAAVAGAVVTKILGG